MWIMRPVNGLEHTDGFVEEIILISSRVNCLFAVKSIVVAFRGGSRHILFFPTWQVNL